MPNCKNCGKEVVEGLLMCEECSKVKPGSFYTPSEEQRTKLWARLAEVKRGRQEEDLPIPEVSENIVGACRLFTDHFRPEVNLVYYPSCGIDISPSTAFKNSHVVYVDLDKNCVTALRQKGFDAREEDAKTFQPNEPIDILILLNPGGTGEEPAKHVANDGYVLCNDYHQTATHLNDNLDFIVVGVVSKSKDDDEQLLVTDHLEQYWEEVQSDEELKQAPFSFSRADRKMVLNILKKRIGEERLKQVIEDGKLVVEYKKILAEAKARSTKLEDSNQEDENFLVDTFGEDNELLLSLPRKKGTVDDIYIYQRVIKTPEWAKKFVLRRGSMEFSGKNYYYHILAKNLEPNLEGFVGFPQGEYLFCSEDVPEEYRRFILGHEIGEFTELAKQPGRCLTSLKLELAEVPEEILSKYIAYRKSFFARLVDYYKDKKVTDEFKQEIQLSYEYLKQL